MHAGNVDSYSVLSLGHMRNGSYTPKMSHVDQYALAHAIGHFRDDDESQRITVTLAARLS